MKKLVLSFACFLALSPCKKDNIETIPYLIPQEELALPVWLSNTLLSAKGAPSYKSNQTLSYATVRFGNISGALADILINTQHYY